MANNTVYHGLNISWGTAGLACSAFGASAIITSADVEKRVDEATILDQYGSAKAWIGYNGLKEATFEYIGADATTPPVGTAVVTQPAQGDIISVTGGEAGLDGTYWIVKSVTERAMNTDAVKVTVRATLYPNITV